MTLPFLGSRCWQARASPGALARTCSGGVAPVRQALRQRPRPQWSHWGKYTAFGTSDDVLFPPACTAHSGSLYLGRPRSHNGRKGFTRMTMRNGSSTLRFHLNSRGYWDQVTAHTTALASAGLHSARR
jgi:hypothetical protein